MTPRYAIEATNLANRNPTGISRYTRHLVAELAALGKAGAGHELVLLYRASRWKRRAQLPRGPGLALQLWQGRVWPPRKRYALVHCPDHRLPRWDGVPKIVTVHDVFSAVGINFEDPAARARQNAIYADFARRAQRLIFVSDSSRRDFLRHFPYDEARTRVIHLGVGGEFGPRSADAQHDLRARLGLTRPYLLFLGLQNPNKNLARLLEAFARSPVRGDHELVLAGAVPADQRSALEQRIAQLGLEREVRALGYVAERDVVDLYATAAALLLPSLYEGFGIPILEAMACATPVLTSNVSSCPEVAGGHAVLANPQSVDDIARGLDQVVRVPPEAREAARRYAATKTWRATAQATLDLYRELAG